MSIRQFGRGANDTAEGVGITFNAEPDYTELARRDAEPTPLYPHIRTRGSPKDQFAYKHHPAWQDKDIDNIVHGDLGQHVDKVIYQASLNGAYRQGDLPYMLADRLVPMGFSGDDILMTEGTSKDGIVKLTGKLTIPNTGTETLNYGDLVYLDYPDTDPARMFSGGCSKMEHVPEGYLTLWTQPYDEAIHRCVPAGLKYALDNNDDDQRTNFGQHLNAKGLVEGAISAGVVLLGILASDADLKRKLKEVTGKESDRVFETLIEHVREQSNTTTVKQSLVDKFSTHWLAPLGVSKISTQGTAKNLLFPNDAQLSVVFPEAHWYEGGAVRGESLYRGGSAFIPTSLLAHHVRSMDQAAYVARPVGHLSHTATTEISWKDFILRHQLTSSENLCYFANKANSFFTRRIIGQARSSSRVAAELDFLPLGPFGMAM